MSQGIDEEICRSVADAQRETQALKECGLDRRENELLKQQVENLKKESALKDEMLKVKDQRIANDEKIIEQWKDIADRSIKLAEVKKPSSVWETWGPLGVIAIVVVTIASVI